MSDRYRLPPGQRTLAADRIGKNEGFVPQIYNDTHNPPIPTIGYGQSLTDKNQIPWEKETLRDTFTRMGVITPPDVDSRLKAAVDAGVIEGWRPNGDYRNPPPLGITVSPEMAKLPLNAAIDRGAEEIRNKLGQDAAGTYNWDKLNADQHNALLDAQYNAPSYIGPNLVKALQHQDDPDWQNKARYELSVNILQPSRRTWENAGAFRQIQDVNPDPPQNLLNSDSFLQSPVENLFNSDAERDNLLNSIQRKLEDDMAPQWQRPSAG